MSNLQTKNIQSDILLIGQPNVGKSVLFSRITGLSAIASNYAGTTVSYTSGSMVIGDENLLLVDAPGIYSLDPIDQVAKVAIDLVDGAKRIINVIDSTHLERQLPLTMELLAQGIPMILALNMTDEARHRGIEIDYDKLSQLLEVPVVPITARTGEGIKDLVLKTIELDESDKQHADPQNHPQHHPHIPSCEVDCSLGCSGCQLTDEHRTHIHLNRKDVWAKVGEIVSRVQTLEHRHHTFIERLEDLSVDPIFGALVALIVMVGSFSLIRMIGEFLIGGGIGIWGDPWVELPFGTDLLFNSVWLPILTELSGFLGGGGFLHNLLIGNLIDGKIDFLQSFGVLTTGIYVPLAAVMPYIFSFYLVMSILEDSGYLPRLAIFLDNIMHKVGLHGYAIVPTLLGVGCNVPGIMATRILETRWQRFVTATLISIAVPCAALQAMIIGMVGKHGFLPLATVYLVLALSWLVIGVVLRFFSKGEQPELLIEIPPYRVPMWSSLLYKMKLRMVEFVKEALPIVMISIFVVNLIYQMDLFRHLASFTAPLVSVLWGMPEESIVPLLIGILRKDVAVGMFAPLNMTIKQLVIGCTVLSMFFPCIATFAILFKELGWKDTMKSTMIMLVVVLVVGTTMNLVLPAFN